jgi:hypothetical protein
VAQDYQPDQWYRLEVVWGTDNSITGNLYDSDGVTLLNSVTATVAPQFTSGGIAFRALGSDKYFDTVVVDSDSTATAQQIVDAGGGLDPNWMADVPPPPPSNGPPGGPAPVPWDYTSVPKSGRDVELASFNQLSQVFGGGIVGGVVGLAAQNVSAVHGSQQIGWGPEARSGSSDVPLETPLLAQYLFRQLPGEDTQLIGASSVKHFFDSSHSDYQHLNPGENDTYGSGLNTLQSLYTYGSEMDPVTGELHSPVDLGHLNNDGITVADNRHFDNRIQYLLQASVSDLDPAQNPDGTRWYLMGNLWVAGDQDVSNNSRWVEVTPAFNGATFTFTYPNGSGGQADFRTIPGLVPPTGPAAVGSDASGFTAAPADRVRVTFDSPLNASTFALPPVAGFTRTDRPGPTGVRADPIAVSPLGSPGRPSDVASLSRTAAGASGLTRTAPGPAPREAVPATDALDGLFARLGEEATPL